jgi:hypothetical protein
MRHWQCLNMLKFVTCLSWRWEETWWWIISLLFFLWHAGAAPPQAWHHLQRSSTSNAPLGQWSLDLSVHYCSWPEATSHAWPDCVMVVVLGESLRPCSFGSRTVWIGVKTLWTKSVWIKYWPTQKRHSFNPARILTSAHPGRSHLSLARIQSSSLWRGKKPRNLWGELSRRARRQRCCGANDSSHTSSGNSSCTSSRRFDYTRYGGAIDTD